VHELPGGGESRPGQVTMAEAVGHALLTHKHLIVEAGTGTGKSLAYLIPAVLTGKRVVVATATKALQDQLANKDLPFLAEHVRDLGHEFTFAVLKGRSNYACVQRIAEVAKANGELELGDLGDGFGLALRSEIRRLVAWAADDPVGDRANLSFEPSPRAWQAISITSDACPGATRCPKGESCLAEKARRTAGSADVVVVNTHLYGMHVASGGVVLPEHEAVVIDEAHMLEDIMSDTLATTIGPGRFAALARTVGAVIEDPSFGDDLANTGVLLVEAIAPYHGQRLPNPLPGEIARVLTLARSRVGTAVSALVAIPATVSDEVKARKLRAQLATGSLATDLDLAMDVPRSHVTFIGGPPSQPHIEIAPIDVADTLKERLFSQATVILTSATIPTGLGHRLGMAAGSFDELDVGSPFDFEHQGLLYCATHLPDPRDPAYRAELHAELRTLILAAGGRTLGLFTSWKAMTEAVAAIRDDVPYHVLAQGDLPKPALMAKFTDDETSCLFATVGYWQGIDVPGPSLSLVTIDRIPFPRPDDPLLQARRELVGAHSFREIDVPRAATLLAQGAGRLIRSSADRGVVAVFDRRLATANYRWDLINALPPLTRTKDLGEVEAFLRSLGEHPPVVSR
jgi:ATP-dependent DNA helicase DinG